MLVTLIFAAETESDKLQEMINTDPAAIDRHYDAIGMIRNHGREQLANSETKVPL